MAPNTNILWRSTLLLAIAGGCDLKVNDEGDSSTALESSEQVPECRWLTKETYPEQIDGFCTYAKAPLPPVHLSLKGLSQPNPETLAVIIGEEKLPLDDFSYDKTTESLHISDWNTQGNPQVVKVYYVAAPATTSEDESSATLTEMTGTVIDASELDGCRYLIETEQGKFLPTNLDVNFQKPGQKIRFSYRLATGTMTICMAGQSIEIIKAAPVTGD